MRKPETPGNVGAAAHRLDALTIRHALDYAKEKAPAGSAAAIRVIPEAAECLERIEKVLAEIAVDVKLADDLSPEDRVAALWQVVRRHTQIAKEALYGD